MQTNMLKMGSESLPREMHDFWQRVYIGMMADWSSLSFFGPHDRTDRKAI